MLEQLNTKLDKLAKEAEKEYVKIIGHKPKYEQISLDNAKSRWGCCKHRGNKHFITIAKRLVENYSDKEIKTTILHEFLHTEKDCHAHDNNWKRKARKFDKLGYNIQRTSNREEPIEQKGYKYQVKCTYCGRVVNRRRLCTIIQHPDWYRCHICKTGTFERIK